MSNHSRRALKRTGAAIVAALAGATGVAFVPGTAGALPGFEFTRINGDDRYATAADIALAAFPGGTTEAILATGEAFPDALAGNYLAGALGAPILLAHHDDVPETTLDALDALGVTNVTLLGGTGALDDGVAAELSGEGYTVDRISGINRYDTAKLIAVQGGPSGVGTIGGAETAIVTTGENFPDALAIGPVAYDESFPVLLTPTGSLSPSVGEAIDELNIEHVIILGGTVAVSTATENTLLSMGVTTERIEGENRFATAAAIADRAVADFGFGVSHVNVAFGRNFPDALAGGPLGGEEHSVTLLTDSDEASTESCTWLEGHASTLATGHALGGTNAINNLVLAQLRECAGAEAPNEAPRANQDYNSTPSTPVLGVLGTDGIARQEYTFSDILPGTKVDVTFIPCFAEAIATDGSVSINDDPVPLDFFIDIAAGEEDDAVHPFTGIDYMGAGHGLYLLGNDNTNILFVNGEIQPGGTHYVDDFVVPGTGSVTVEYISQQSDCVIPLVFNDANSDDTLQVTPDTNLPVEDFSVGGAFIASNGEAASGQEIDGNVMFNNAAEGYFVLDDDNTPIVDGNVFFYDETDSFFAEGNYPPFISPGSDFALSIEEWENSLSPLDEIDDDFADQDYSRSAPNEFEVDDDYAGYVTGVTVTMGDLDDIPGDTFENDALITFNTPNPQNAWITDYEVDLYNAADGSVFAFFAGFDSDDDPQPDTIPEPNQDVDNDNIDDDVDNSIIVEDLPLGTYVAVVHALTVTGDESVFASEPSAPFSSPGAPGAPLSTSAIFQDFVLLNCCGTVTGGDIITITFDQPLDAVAANATIVARDTDGTVWRLTNGVNAAFAVAANVLTITVNPNPTILQTGANGIANLPSDVLSSTGISAGGIVWNIVDSPDITIA